MIKSKLNSRSKFNHQFDLYSATSHLAVNPNGKLLELAIYRIRNQLFIACFTSDQQNLSLETNSLRGGRLRIDFLVGIDLKGEGEGGSVQTSHPGEMRPFHADGTWTIGPRMPLENAPMLTVTLQKQNNDKGITMVIFPNSYSVLARTWHATQFTSANSDVPTKLIWKRVAHLEVGAPLFTSRALSWGVWNYPLPMYGITAARSIPNYASRPLHTKFSTLAHHPHESISHN